MARLISPITQNNIFPNSIRKSLNLFAFFLAFPIFDLFSLSITFYIFIFTVYKLVRIGLPIFNNSKGNKIFFYFLVSALISTIFYPDVLINVTTIESITNCIQISYWIVMALFFKTYINDINWLEFSKYIFWGLVLLIISFYFIPIKYDLLIAKINLKQSRNSVVFNTLTFLPLITFYILNSKFKAFKGWVILFFFISFLFTNGRSGFVLIILQLILLGPIYYPRRRFAFRLLLFGMIFLSFIWYSLENSAIVNKIATYVEKINPRAASLLTKDGNDGNLDVDKSWLLRVLMVDKSLEILSEFPIKGLGWFNFTNYSANLNPLNEYGRLGGHDESYYNTKSAHNSYAQLLAEGGLLGAMFFLILFIPLLIYCVKGLVNFTFSMNELPLISLLILFIYFYVISSLTGSGTWVIIGLSSGVVSNLKNKLIS